MRHFIILTAKDEINRTITRVVAPTTTSPDYYIIYECYNSLRCASEGNHVAVEDIVDFTEIEDKAN